MHHRALGMRCRHTCVPLVSVRNRLLQLQDTLIEVRVHHVLLRHPRMVQRDLCVHHDRVRMAHLSVVNCLLGVRDGLVNVLVAGHGHVGQERSGDPGAVVFYHTIA